MQSNIKDFNPTLGIYMNTLQNESKFKAKVLYTLTCIQNSLNCSGAAYIADLIYLSKHQYKLLDITNMHKDYSILQQMANIFCKFEQMHLQNIHSKQYLDIINNNIIQGHITDGFVQYICKLLSILKHQYQKTKLICMKLLQNSNNTNKLTQNQCKLILQTMTNASLITKQQCYKLLICNNIKNDKLLQLLWKSCLINNTNSINTNNKNCSINDVENRIIKKCIQQEWYNEIIKYKGMRISIWNNINQNTGNIQKLIPQYIDIFYRCNPKPIYKSIQNNNQIKIDNFQHILKSITTQLYYCNSQNTNKIKQQINALIISKYSKQKQKQQILSCMVNNTQISAMNRNKYLYIIPIQYIYNLDNLYEKLNNMPSPENAYKVIIKLNIIIGKQNDYNDYTQIAQYLQIYMKILQIYLVNKKCEYLKIIEQIISQTFRRKPQLLLNIIKSHPQYVLLLPCIQQYLEQNKQKQKIWANKIIDKYINNQNIPIQYKFYMANCFIKIQFQQGVSKFIFYLLRNLNKQYLPYQEISYYLKNNTYSKQQIQWLYASFQEEIQRIQQKIFGRLVDHDFKAPKLIIFALDKYQIFAEWHPIYRWTLNPLDQPNFQNSQALIDSFQVFQTVIQGSKHVHLEVIKKFFLIVAKHWESYNHHHMFTIERISVALFSDQELSAQDLQQITNYLKNLTKRPWSGANPQLYRLSFELLIKNTLMEQTEQIDQNLLNVIFGQLTKLETAPFKNYQTLKIKLFAQELLMWRFQYEQATIHQKVAQSLIKVTNNFDKFQIVNQSDRQILVQNSLQIISTVGHQCNLLDISLIKILRYYPTNKNILLYVIQIICNIKQINMKALAKFQLQKFIPQMLTTMIFNTDQELNSSYIQLLQQLCVDQQSPYHNVFNNSKNLLIQIIRMQGIIGLQNYRPEIANFALNKLLNINKQEETQIQNYLHRKWIQNIWTKYSRNEDVKKVCEDIQPKLKTQNNIINHVNKMNIQNTEIIQRNKQAKVNYQKFLQNQQQKQKQQYIKKQQQAKQNKQQQSKTQDKSEKKELQTKSKSPKKPKIQIKSDQIQETDKQKILQETKQKVKIKLQMPINIEQQKQQHVIIPSPPKIGESKQKQSGFGFGFPKVPKTNSLKNDKQVKKKRTRREGDDQQMQNINNIKGHVNLIGSFSGSKVNQQQKVKLSQSFTYLADVVNIHSFYCQKVVNLGIVNKTISLLPQVQTVLLDKILQLFLEISENKQKNLTIFNDTKSIDFFKRVLKQSIASKKQLPSNDIVIKIIGKCWNSSNDFFANGLLSMLFQMAKIQLSREKTLQLLSMNELSYQIVNQIYQRGLFNVMELLFKKDIKDLTQKDKRQICHWTRLMGKVCLNNSIRQKLYSIQYHNLVYNKMSVLHQQNCVQNIAFLFANFTYQFPKIANWCIQKRIPGYFIEQMNEYQKIPTQFYKFFRYFSQNGNQCIKYLFKINYHTHMIQIIQSDQQKLFNQGFKHFYKSLSHLFVPQYYQIFLKAQVVELLIKKFEATRSHYILQCLYKLTSQIKTKSEVQILERQKLFSLNSVFNSKIKDDLSYPFFMDIYLDLLKKFKNIDCKMTNLQLANKLIRKGIYTINMQGKKKAIQLVILLSEIDKTDYSNANCLKIIQSLVNYNTGQQQLNLVISIQQIQTKYKKSARTQQQQRKQQQKFPLRFKNINQIKAETFLDTLMNKFIQLRKNVENTQNSQAKLKDLELVDKIVQILRYFCKLPVNRKQIYNKLGNLLMRNFICKQNYESSLKLFAQLLQDKQIANLFANGSAAILTFIQNTHDHLCTLNSPNSELIQCYKQLLEACLKYGLIERQAILNFINKTLKQGKLATNQKLKQFIKQSSQIKQQSDITQQMKQQMLAGVKVKMYKQDGSSSNLILHFTIDLLQLNCVVSIGQAPKSKWRLSINQIQSVRDYTNSDVFKQSTFYLSQGIFTKAPPMQNCLLLKGKSKNFYICFETVVALQQWKKLIQLARVRAAHLILAIGR